MTTKLINELEFDVHWYRRVFHAFAASFLVYYMLPDALVFSCIKIGLPIVGLTSVFILEYCRIRGRISSSNFFGLRIYEARRAGSYLYFGVAVVILLFFFPQQIAVPCILCACLADPVMGELRFRFGKTAALLGGFLVCLLFFGVVWFQAGMMIMIPVSLLGASAAVVGETKKFWWLDDDFMIQMLPAIVIVLAVVLVNQMGVDILPDPVIHPGLLPW